MSRRGIHPEQAVAGGFQFDFALFYLAAGHVLLSAESQQPLRRVVFVHHAGGHLPDVKVLLAHGEQHGDVLLRNDVPLAEPGVLVLVLDDLGHVVAQYLAHGVLRADQLHAPLQHLDFISGTDGALFYNHGENALRGHDAFAHRLLDGAVAVALLADLGDLHFRLPDPQTGAHRQMLQVDAHGVDVLREHPGDPAGWGTAARMASTLSSASREI